MSKKDYIIREDSMEKIVAIQITALLIIAGSLGGMLVFTDVYDEIKARIVSVLCLSCIKLEPKLDLDYRFDTANSQNHPPFVLDQLLEGIVFLHYSADACHGCDIIYPVIKQFFNVEYEKDEMFSDIIIYDDLPVAYYYTNVDHANQEMRDSYEVYDIGGQGARPMCTIITLKYDRGIVKPYYVSIYGTFGENDEERVSFLTQTLESSIDLYNEFRDGYIPE